MEDGALDPRNRGAGDFLKHAKEALGNTRGLFSWPPPSSLHPPLPNGREPKTTGCSVAMLVQGPTGLFRTAA